MKLHCKPKHDRRPKTKPGAGPKGYALMTLDQAATIMGVSLCTAWKCEQRALKKIKAAMTKHPRPGTGKEEE